MDTATILTTINYNDFTPMDMIYIIEELSEIHGRDKVKTTLKSIITLMEKYEKEHYFLFLLCIRTYVHSRPFVRDTLLII